MYIDTQLIRNAYLQRPVEQIDLPFGEFACVYLSVNDTWLACEHNISQACNYIIKQGYNNVPDPNQVALDISMAEAYPPEKDYHDGPPPADSNHP